MNTKRDVLKAQVVNEYRAWINYMFGLCYKSTCIPQGDEQRSEEDMFVFDRVDVLFNLFSSLNWLAHVMEDKEKLRDSDLVTFISNFFDWEKPAAKAFYFLGRNQVMHTGRTYAWQKNPIEVDMKTGHNLLGASFEISGSNMIIMRKSLENGYYVNKDQLIENEHGDGEEKKLDEYHFLVPAILEKMEKQEEKILAYFDGLTEDKLEELDFRTHKFNLCRIPAPQNGGKAIKYKYYFKEVMRCTENERTYSIQRR